MKSIRLNILLLLLAASPASLMAQSNKAWVRELDLELGGQAMVYLPTDLGGAYVPVLPVSSVGNRYRLYAEGTAWDKEVYLLDEKVISSYSPAAKFTIDTGDPYVRGDEDTPNYVKRTRADQVYNMTVQISGVKDASTDPAVNSVHLVVTGLNYWPDTYSPLAVTVNDPSTPQDDRKIAKVPYDIPSEEAIFKYNGVKPPMTGLMHKLNEPADKRFSVGEMKFTVWRYAADGVPNTVIAEPRIEIWPMAKASFHGVANNQVFIDAIPEIVFKYQDLYPDSHTYVQIYKGPQKDGTKGTIVATTECKYGEHYVPGVPKDSHATVPQNASIAVSGLSSYTPKDGIYTMEIVTETPFNGRQSIILDHVTFEVDQFITSRGKLSTAE